MLKAKLPPVGHAHPRRARAERPLLDGGDARARAVRDGHVREHRPRAAALPVALDVDAGRVEAGVDVRHAAVRELGVPQLGGGGGLGSEVDAAPEARGRSLGVGLEADHLLGRAGRDERPRVVLPDEQPGVVREEDPDAGLEREHGPARPLHPHGADHEVRVVPLAPDLVLRDRPLVHRAALDRERDRAALPSRARGQGHRAGPPGGDLALGVDRGERRVARLVRHRLERDRGAGLALPVRGQLRGLVHAQRRVVHREHDGGELRVPTRRRRTVRPHLTGAARQHRRRQQHPPCKDTNPHVVRPSPRGPKSGRLRSYARGRARCAARRTQAEGDDGAMTGGVPPGSGRREAGRARQDSAEARQGPGRVLSRQRCSAARARAASAARPDDSRRVAARE